MFSILTSSVSDSADNMSSRKKAQDDQAQPHKCTNEKMNFFCDFRAFL